MERLKLRVNASFWVFLAVAVIFKQGYLATLYTLAMLLHETAHYVVAKKLFYRCNEIRVSIFGAVLYGDFQDVAGADRIKIALAGPMCNFVMCVLCLALWWIAPQSYYFSEAFFLANASMGCVNLLPCYPLDGGRVLTGVLENKLGKKPLKFTKICTYVCSILLFCVFIVSLFTRQKLFNVGLFALCLFCGVFTENGGECYVKTTFTQNKKRFLRHGMEKKTLVFDCNSSLRDVAKRMQGNYLYCLEVVDENMNVRRRYNVAQLENLVVSCPLDTPLNQLEKHLF